MTRYFSETFPKQNKPGETFSRVITAVSDTPDREGRYPSSNMAALVYPAKATPNFRLDHQTSEPRVPRGFNQFEQVVSNETGIKDPLNSLTAQHRLTFDAAAGNVYELESSKSRNKANSHTRRTAGINYAKNIRSLKRATSELFTTTPEQAVVGSAFSHKSMRHTIPIMGAYLHQQHGDVAASADLSSHSTKLVKNLQEKGYPVSVEGGRKPAVTNDIGFYDSMRTMHPAQIRELEVSGREMSGDEIASAKQHFRNVRKGQKLSDQFDAHIPTSQGQQLQLPGMENT
jgi:predicted heme/steroid binding protein